jgi:hypothetical protein
MKIMHLYAKSPTIPNALLAAGATTFRPSAFVEKTYSHQTFRKDNGLPNLSKVLL